MNKSDVAVYIPVRNAQEWAASTSLPGGVEINAVDNCSSDQTAAILVKRGVSCVVNRENLGRVGNWAECVAGFVQSDKRWMKWLFSGDELSSEFASIIGSIDEASLTSGFVLFDTMNDSGKRQTPREYGLSYGYNSPHEVARAVACRSFGFNGPIAQMIRRDLATTLHFRDELPFVAFEMECLRLSSIHGLCWMNAVAGEFVSSKRLYLRSERQTTFAGAQMYVLRAAALRVLEKTQPQEVQCLSKDLTASFAIQAFFRSMRQYPGVTLKKLLHRFFT